MKHFYFLLPCFLCFTVSSQNLVNNNSFETRTGEPTGSNQLSKCTGWSTNSNTTADFKTTSGTGTGAASTTGASPCAFLPAWGGTNECGPTFDGTAVLGLYTKASSSPQTRETAHGTLTTPMTIGTNYDISFAVRSANNNGLENAHTVDNLGLAFSTSDLSGTQWRTTTPAFWAGLDKVYTPTGTPIDNTDWVEYSYTITATAANGFVAVGNLLDEASMSWWYYGTLGGYYWMDDLVVQEVVPMADDEIEIVAEVLSSNVIEVNWEPLWMNLESNYELLRSSDGKSFVTVDRVNGRDFAEFKSIDVNPGAKNIYYKVREIQEDGKRKSSDEIRVDNPFISGKLELSVRDFHNGVWNVQFVGGDIGMTNINILDIEGRVVYSESVEINKGKNQIDLRVGDLQAGIYICSLDGLGQKKVPVLKMY